MMLNLLITLCVIFSSCQALNFLAVGDWGGIEYKPYYTPGQKASAVGMDKVAGQLQAEFVLAVGDNYYHQGVTDENDSRFKSTFETVYTGANLQKDWYAIAGNHDHNGNVTAQIAYSAESARWKFPAAYHKHSFSSADGATVDIIMIDTVDLASMNHQKSEEEEGYFNPLPLRARAEAENQWTWIESSLQASTADYVIVVGHYPVYSVCEHGNTQTLVDILRPMLVQYQAHYLAGHDHCMEHLVDTEGGVNYWLSGMGAYCCYRPSNKDKVPADLLKWYTAVDNINPVKTTAGFTSYEVTKQGMVVKFYDQDGAVLYTGPTVLPRKL
eukprot:gene25825-31189_t